MSVHAARAIRQKHKGDPESVENALSPEQKKVLVEAFEAADKNGDGILSVDEYNDIFQSHGLSIGKFCHYFEPIQFETSDPTPFSGKELNVLSVQKKKRILYPLLNLTRCVCLANFP